MLRLGHADRTIWLLVVATGLCGCRMLSPSGAEYWAAPPEETIFPDSPRQRENDVFSESSGRISLRSAINETVAAQIVLRGTTPDAAVTRLACRGLSGPQASIPADAVRFHVVRFTRIDSYPAWFLQRTELPKASREYPDILLPVGNGSPALPAQLAADRNTLIWMELHVPLGTPRGSYTGEIEIGLRNHAGLRVPINVEVWPFALPDLAGVTAVAPLSWATIVAHHVDLDGKPYRPARLAADDPLRPAALAAIDATLRLLHAHRVSGLLTDLYPQRRLTTDGAVEIDWSDYDTIVAAYLDGSAFDNRVPLAVWPLPVSERFPPPDAYGGVHTATYAAALWGAVDAGVRHFTQRNWLDRHIVLMGPLGRSRGDEYAAWHEAATRFRAAGKQIRLACDLPPQSMAPLGWVGHPFLDPSGLAGAWCSPARYAGPRPATATQPAAWPGWQPDVPPYSGSLAVVSPPCDIRSLAWQSSAWSDSMIWLVGAADWPDEAAGSGRVPEPSAATTWLLYPGRPFGLDAPVPSIRLKHLHRGLQDAAYVWLLRKQQRPAIADIIAGGLWGFGGIAACDETHADGRAYGWARDPAIWRLGRELMAAELLRAAERSPVEPFEQLRERLDWQRFLGATRRPLAWTDGIRLRSDPRGPASVRVEASVATLNRSTRTIEARASCSPLPSGWESAEAAQPFAVDAGSFARRTLTLAVSSFSCDAADRNGLLSLPMRVQFADDEIEASGRLAVLRPMRLTRPLTIDGDLHDWPPGEGNQAGDFVLVGGQDVPKAGRERPDRPTESTLVFVCWDDDALYVAFNCRDSRLAERVIRQTNYVEYEGMTPVGEDLVEILLDPGATAKGPGDLYHLVVKANGAVIAERGIGCEPPIGPRQPWNVDAQVGVASGPEPNRWFVEARLGWSSFDAGARRSSVWGINFARLAARPGEYSCWSGARWNIYSPRTLGNLWFQR